MFTVVVFRASHYYHYSSELFYCSVDSALCVVLRCCCCFDCSLCHSLSLLYVSSFHLPIFLSHDVLSYCCWLCVDLLV